MTDLRKAAKMALEALDNIHSGNLTPMAEESWTKAKEALRQALAHPEHEPVAWVQPNGKIVVRTDYGGRLYYSEQNVYTAPPSIEAAVLAEREACAEVCDTKVDAEYATGKVDHNEIGWTQVCAALIRARGEK